MYRNYHKNEEGTTPQKSVRRQYEDKIPSFLQPEHHLSDTTTPISSKPRIIYVFSSYGLGSELVNMLAHKLLFQDMGRDFVVDTSWYGYRWNQSVGVLKGFFTPRFPVIDHTLQYPSIEQQYNISNYKQLVSISAVDSEKTIRAKLQAATTAMTMVTPMTPFTRNMIFRHLQQVQRQESLQQNLFFYRMALETCQNLKFNEQALDMIHKVQSRHGIPHFRQAGITSVAFHVRRGDKLQREAKRRYDGSDYVDKMIQVVDKRVDYCFVASDDFAAIAELRQVLQNHRNASNVQNCSVYSLTPPSARGAFGNHGQRSSRLATARFLTELFFLTEATYFIGTFHSNVATLVALLRQCVHRQVGHYANSYGVDTDTWYLR